MSAAKRMPTATVSITPMQPAPTRTAASIQTLRRHALLLATVIALAACSSPSTPVARSAPPRAATPAATLLVAQVRAAGNAADVLEVQPLRDPRVEDLRDTATRLEAEGDIEQAKIAIADALAIVPGDPDLLQWFAELALYGKDWIAADQLARRSFKLGPQLGGLCRRNWTTVRIVGQAQDNATAIDEAHAALAQCTVAPPVRM